VTHRHSPPGQHEHDFEAARGLPEALPEGEVLLWQGSPDWRHLARRVFHVRKLMVYFALILLARGVNGWANGEAPGQIVGAVLGMLPLAALGIGLLMLFAWLYGRTTVYSLTNRRVVMRIGIVLSMTLNLPLQRIEAADLRGKAGETGDIALRLVAGDKIAYLHLWPHARPWRLARPEPMLRSLNDAGALAELLAETWAHAQQQPRRAVRTSQHPTGAEAAAGASSGLVTS
jgi:hypothetical protein